MYEKPEKVEGGIPEEYIASKSKDDLKTDIIPLPRKGQWLQIDYYDYPTGNVPHVWRKVNNRMAALENEAKRKEKNNEPVSLGVIATQLEELYLDGSIRYMVQKINGVEVNDEWFEFHCNDSMRKVLQVWRKCQLESLDYPDPAWLETGDDDAKNE